MLNIIKSKLKNIYNKKSNNSNVVRYNKDLVPVVRNWKSSIYGFNKNTMSLIPTKSRFVMKLIKDYFDLYHLGIESILRRTYLRRKNRKTSTNKIFVGDGEFKHTNDKVNITLYVYNRQKLNYLLKLKRRYLRLFKKAKFVSKLKLIRNVGLNILKQQKEKSTILINVLPKYNPEVYSAQNVYYKRFIKKCIRRLRYYMLYKQLLYINKTKFENSYLQHLIILIKKIFNKNVELNIINLKYFYFNSNIYTQPLVLKLRRKKADVAKYLRILTRKVKIKNVKLVDKSNIFFTIDNLYNNDLINNTIQQDKTNVTHLKKIILSKIKYKRVSGVRLEVAGKISKRSSVTRSQFRAEYKGNLKNAYSSFKGYSTPVLRGNFKSNLQYTVINSKSHLGSFGAKG
jgi:hypothetical protein